MMKLDESLETQTVPMAQTCRQRNWWLCDTLKKGCHLGSLCGRVKWSDLHTEKFCVGFQGQLIRTGNRMLVCLGGITSEICFSNVVSDCMARQYDGGAGYSGGKESSS